MNMNNINNNITKFNGQYLKCIVSNYTSTKNYLGNSGSLIVIQPKSGKLNDVELETAYKNGDMHRNYVYLGNEFLASGFGFGAQYLLEKAEVIVNDYDSTIEELHNKDIELDKKINTKVEEIYNELENYVKTNGGHIENTVIALNGQVINTRDIILYGEEAQYKNLEVNDIKILINDNECNDDTIFLPIGSSLDKINVELEISKNDSGGISTLEVLHNINETDSEYEGTKIEYNLDSDITINKEYSIYRLYYEKKFNDDSFIIDSYKPEVLKSLYVYVKETPISAYKYYPGIYRKYNVKITSSGNAIAKNVLNLNKVVNIRPQYYAKYTITNAATNNLVDEYFGAYPLNSFSDYDQTTMMFDITDNVNSSDVYIAIPSNFSINKIYVILNHTEKYNWTGAVNIIKDRMMKCPGIGNKDLYIKYDIYHIYSETGFEDNDDADNITIEANIIYNNIKDRTVIDGDYDNKPKSSDEINPNDTVLTGITTVETINDEEFNNIYWINADRYTIDNNNDLLINKLNEVSINGAKK